VDEEALHPPAAHVLEEALGERVEHALDGRLPVELEPPRAQRVADVVPDRRRLLLEPLGRFGEAEVEAGLAAPRARPEELEPEERLPRAGAAEEHGRRCL